MQYIINIETPANACVRECVLHFTVVFVVVKRFSYVYMYIYTHIHIYRYIYTYIDRVCVTLSRVQNKYRPIFIAGNSNSSKYVSPHL